jgi:site-specific DNA-methyltransferase (adenine-specific)
MSALGPYALGRVHKVEALAALLALPSDSVDMICADSPYSSGGFTRSDRNADPSQKYERDDVAAPRRSFSGDNRDARSWVYWTQLWTSECLRVAREGAYLLSFTDWRMLPSATDAIQAGGWIWRGLIGWDKGEAARAPHTGYWRHQCEYIVWGTKGPLKPATHGGPWPGYFHVPVKQSDKHHLTGKPTELMRQLVRAVPPGAIVLDPFAGSGTTIVACELEARVGLGFEQEEPNVLTANERIEAARVSLDAAAKRANQQPLFGAPLGEPAR